MSSLLPCAGAIKPLPPLTHSLGDAALALRQLSAARHIGKIVVEVPQQVNPQGICGCTGRYVWSRRHVESLCIYEDLYLAWCNLRCRAQRRGWAAGLSAAGWEPWDRLLLTGWLLKVSTVLPGQLGMRFPVFYNF